MPTQVQFRRGTTVQNDAFTGAVGEISVDTTLDTVRLHDGSTQGGFRLARYSEIQAGDITAVVAGTGLAGGATSGSATVSLSHLGIESLSDPNADRIVFWDDSAGASQWLSAGTGLTITATSIDVGTLNQDTTGNAATATALATARTIGGTSFDGTANIAVALAGTATALATARTIHGVSFDGTANIDLSEVIADTVGAMVTSNTESGITVAYVDADNTIDFTVGTLNQSTTGNAATATLAATATALATARTIGGTSFDGTANIAVGLAGTATALATARTIQGVSFDGSANITTTTAGTGVSVSGTAVSIGQAVATTDKPSFAGITLTADSTVTGNILPSADDTYGLGSASKQWSDVYIGPGSLYVNGQKVVEDDSGTITISADTNQNVKVSTSGSGDVELDPTGSGQIELKGPVQVTAGSNVSSSDGNAISFSNAIDVDAIESRSTDTNLTLSANGTGIVTVNDALTVTGDLIVSGTTTTVNSATINLADNIIMLNSDFTSGTPSEDTGFSVLRGGSATKSLLWDETNDRWTVSTEDFVATTFIGALTGNVSGNVTGSSGSTTGNAATATALATARTIGGTSFDGTANIAVGLAGTATALATARTIGGVSFDGTANINLPGVNASGTQNTSGLAATATLAAGATALATARTIHGVSFDGSANIDLSEEVADTVGAMFSSNTETGITATYQDADNTIDLVVGTLNQDTTGLAGTATALATARTIGGVSFDGTANINLPGVNSAGNQATSGLAATATLAAGATVLATARTIGGVSFDGSANINLPGVNSAGNQATSGLAATATLAAASTALATGRTIGMTGDVVWTSASFDGTGNVTGSATIQANSVDLGTHTTGNYMAQVSGGNGVTISHSQGEGSTATITGTAIYNAAGSLLN